LFDESGDLMTPSFSKKRGSVCYRYYVSQALLQNRGGHHLTIVRVPATVVEELVAQAVERYLRDASSGEVNWYGRAKQAPLREVLEKVVIGKDGVRIHLRDKAKLVVPGVLVRAGKVWPFSSTVSPHSAPPRGQPFR
jgi:hypothetical protein